MLKLIFTFNSIKFSKYAFQKKCLNSLWQLTLKMGQAFESGDNATHFMTEGTVFLMCLTFLIFRKSMRAWQAIRPAAKTVFPGFTWSLSGEAEAPLEWNFSVLLGVCPTALQIRPVFWEAVCPWILDLLSWKFCLGKIAAGSAWNEVIQWSALAKSSLYALVLILSETYCRWFADYFLVQGLMCRYQWSSKNFEWRGFLWRAGITAGRKVWRHCWSGSWREKWSAMNKSLKDLRTCQQLSLEC